MMMMMKPTIFLNDHTSHNNLHQCILKVVSFLIILYDSETILDFHEVSDETLSGFKNLEG